MSATLQNTTNTKKKRKKIVIRSYKTPPQVPADFYETQSNMILTATQSVLHVFSTFPVNLQQAHARVLDLVQLKMGPKLYMDLVESMKQAAQRVFSSDTTTTTSAALLLTTIPEQYAHFLEYLSIVRHVCMPLDRQYVWNIETNQAILRNTSNNNNNTLSLWQVGLLVFSSRLKELSLDQELYNAWWNELWNISWKNTSGNNKKELQECMKMWHELGLKGTILKLQLQPQLIQHFQQESQEQYTNPQDFVTYVYEKWNLVSQVWATFLPKLWVRSLVEVHLLLPNMAEILKQLTIDDMQHVQRLHLLSGRLEHQHSLILERITKYSQERGLSILQQYNYSFKSIQGLLDLLSQLKSLQEKLHTSLPLKTIFSVLMAEPQAAEALAKYMDSAFKSTKSTPPLEQLLQLFCHVSAKDVFEAFYKRDLAKRLLGGRVQNMDLEKHFCSLLKSECGAGYTSKMEGMFQDVEWSRETMARYPGLDDKKIDMDVQVLTTGYWPVYPTYSLNIPQELQVSQNHFDEYYKKTYQGRRIAWQYALGHATVKARFAKQYDLVMSLSLALVVLCFNDDKTKWTLPELEEKVGLDDRDEMERILMTLALGKVKLLQKWDYDAKPGQKPRANVHNEDWFTVNEDFSSPLKKIKISTIAKTDANKEEREKTMDMISRDRLYLLDAVLVRIMKARKTMVHSELIPLVMEHAKVPVTPTDVKGRIESLMDREYLERDKEDRNRYNYLA